MLFNTFEFWVFFLFVFLGNHLLTHKYQNYYLLAASYFFYAGWDWRFLGLILFTTLIAFLSGLYASSEHSSRTRKYAVISSVLVNLIVLGFFKYADFFIGSFIDLFSLPPESRDDLLLNVILPVGISFFTFQSISYTIDIYRGHISPNRRFTDVALYVSFFPQLVAGPIERGAHLMPQISAGRSIDKKQIEAGIYLIAWGLYKKVCIADALAHPVNAVFDSPVSTGAEVYVGVLLFAVQIYCDFSGYTDIARGLAKLLGFNLMLNFNLPYVSHNPSEFWRRWHISLSSWLRDYLYIPLGGSRLGNWKTYRNLMITMLLGGLWHGARYNFLLWGLYHGALLALHRLMGTNTQRATNEQNPNGSFGWLKMVGMFHLTLVGWLLFRVETMEQLQRMSISLLSGWDNIGAATEMIYYALPISLPLVLMQVWQYRSGDLGVIRNLRWPLKAFFVAACISSVVFLNRADGTPFIYFQF